MSVGALMTLALHLPQSDEHVFQDNRLGQEVFRPILQGLQNNLVIAADDQRGQARMIVGDLSDQTDRLPLVGVEADDGQRGRRRPSRSAARSVSATRLARAALCASAVAARA